MGHRTGRWTGENEGWQTRVRVPAFRRRWLHAVGIYRSLPDEKAATAVGFVHRARAWFAAHGIGHIERVVIDNGACYRADASTRALLGAKHKGQLPCWDTSEDQIWYRQRAEFISLRGDAPS